MSIVGLDYAGEAKQNMLCFSDISIEDTYQDCCQEKGLAVTR